MHRGRPLSEVAGSDRGNNTSSLPITRPTVLDSTWTQFNEIPVHGDLLSGKSEGVIRLYFENVDGFSVDVTKNCRHNRKLQYLNNLLRRMEVDVMGAVETRTHYDLLPNSHNLSKLLDQRDGGRCKGSHNKHERFSLYQQGGTCIATNECLVDNYVDSGVDDTGLGRWSWIRLKGKNTVTRIVVAYSPCVTRKTAQSATIAQHRRYWRMRNNSLCPRRLFRFQLIDQLKDWRANGEKLILMMDGNEDMLKGPLSRMLRTDELEMNEVVTTKTNREKIPTFIRGSRQIDGIWLTPDVEMAKCTLLPFHFGVGDHRAILVDIPSASILGDSFKHICRPAARRLQNTNPEVRQKYIERLHSYIVAHQLQHKVYHLFQQPNMNNTVMTTSLNLVDKILGEGMQNAEKHCRKIRAGAVPFSGTLANAGVHIKLWGLVIRHKLGRNVSTRYIRRTAKRCKCSRPLACTLQEARQRKAMAWKSYRKVKKRARQLREEFLREKIEAAKTNKERLALQNILRNEETRRSWRSINKGRGKVLQKGISQVIIQENGQDKLLTDRQQVESAIMENNSKRFHLTDSTPFMTEPLVSEVGFLANTPFVRSILAGDFKEDHRLDKHTNDFLRFLGNHASLNPISHEVSTTDFQQYWRKAKERTSSSISGRHFGHYVAASHCDAISELHSSICHLATMRGIFLSRWTKGLTVMLEKQANVIKVDKLRAILLMEADFNFINKLIFGCRLVKQCEHHNRFPLELFGSRAARSAIEVALNRRITLDVMKVKRRCGAIAGVDAAQCYDRIVHSVASMLCQKEGIQIPAALLMFGAIQSMTYYIRTTFGDSDTHYGGPQLVPFQGTCQGNGASPAIWLVVSMYLVLLMKDDGHKSTILSAYSAVSISFIGFLFVDDTDLVIMGTKQETPVEVQARLQAAITRWNGLLHVTGGALRPEKCYWYLISFIWHNGICKLNTATPPPVTLPQPDGTDVPIAYKSVSTPTEAVGVWQDVDGSSGKHVDSMIKKIRHAHTALETSSLPSELMWVGFRQAIWRSLAYGLPAVTISDKQSKQLAKEIYRPLLSKLGCNRNYPLALRYNPPCMLGLGLYDPYVEQGIAKLEHFTTLGGHNNLTGSLIRTLQEQHQLEIGYFNNFLNLPYKLFHKFTPSSWITEVWEFCDTHKIQLHHSSPHKLSPLRENDVEIMRCFHENLSLSSAELLAINRVRCYLEVLSLADIATGDGKKIRQCYLQGIRSTERSTWEWHEERPCIKDFNIWRKYLPQLLTPSMHIRIPLGKWTTKPHIPWTAFYDRSTDIVYYNPKNVWHVYNRCPSSTRSCSYYTRGRLISVPSPEAVPTTVREINENTIILEGYDVIITDTITTASSQSTNEYWILNNSNGLTSVQSPWLLQGLIHGTLLAVCDGSYKPKLSPNLIAAAWRIEARCGGNLTGTSAVMGHAADAYRAELLGIYGLLSLISYIESSNEQYQKGTLRIGCDNDMAGWMSGQYNARPSTSSSHLDLLKSIRHIQHGLKTRIEFYHIHGHQDKTTEFSLLPRDVQLNCMVDQMAQQHLEDAYTTNSTVKNPVFYHEGWFATIGGVKISHNMAYMVRDWIGKRRLRSYLHDHGYAWSYIDIIDFKPLESYLSHQSQKFKVWFSKHWSNFCGIGSKMKAMGLWQDDLCPCCKQVSERSTVHLFLCTNKTIHEMRQQLFSSIIDWLTAVDTDPCIVQTIRSVWYGTPLHLPEDASPWYRKLYLTLQELGIHAMWMGFLPTELTMQQAMYYNLSGSRRNGSRWGEQLVGKMLRATLQLWITRNSMVHTVADNGINGMDLVLLREAATTQLELGQQGLDEEDYYLLERDIDEIMQDSMENIRGWLCNIYIARGNYEDAQEEGLKDRGNSTHKRPRLTLHQQRQYLDWRNVQLSTDT